MLKKIFSYFFTLIFVIFFTATAFANPIPLNNNSTQFISYWFSWAQGNSQYLYSDLDTVPQGVNQIYVAFALEYDDPGSMVCTSNIGNQYLCIQSYDKNSLVQGMKKLHDQGTKIILSSGGARGNYAWDDNNLTDEQIAEQYIQFIQNFTDNEGNSFDGLDFDVESGIGSRIPNIVSLIKKQYPNLTITLTVGCPASGGLIPAMEKLGKTLYQNEDLNYVNLMNYDQNTPPKNCSYETSNMQQNCYIQNAQATLKVIAQWTHNSTKAKQILSNGIMIGYADDQKIVTPELIGELATWFKQNGYGAVMTWGLNRDQPSQTNDSDLDATTGLTNVLTNAYTQTLIQTLNEVQP